MGRGLASCGTTLQRSKATRGYDQLWDGGLHPEAAGSRWAMKSADSTHFWTQAELPGSLLMLCVPATGKLVLDLTTLLFPG